MANEGGKRQKKKSFLSRVGDVTGSVIGIILMGEGGSHPEITSGSIPNTYGIKGRADLGVPAPDQLQAEECRALYIPRHNGSMKGMLPIHDFTQLYRDNLRDENIGSYKWKYMLYTMSKLLRDDTDSDEIAYSVEMEEFNKEAAEKQVINLRKRSPTGTQGTISL